jgi:hypothetical protein
LRELRLSGGNGSAVPPRIPYVAASRSDFGLRSFSLKASSHCYKLKELSQRDARNGRKKTVLGEAEEFCGICTGGTL